MFLRCTFGVLTLFFGLTTFALDARILLNKQKNQGNISGGFRLICRNTRSASCSSREMNIPEGRWQLQVKKRGVIVKSETSSGKTHKIRGRSFSVRGQFSMEGRSLRHLEIYILKENVDWVVSLPVDQYLYGVLSAEVPSSWPQAALRAQAVASRTYFLFKREQRKSQHYDVRSDILDQVFRWDAKKHRSIVQAVDETHGQVLRSKGSGKIFPAYFHADCGGHTSNEKLVWRSPAALNRGTQDSVCRRAPKNNWSLVQNQDKLMQRLRQVFYLPSGIRLEHILPRLKKENRAHYVDFIFSENIYKRMSANEFRRLLGFGQLRSTHFAVERQGRDFVFSGKGFGHGVGLCQWGAQRWARKGHNYRQILDHYYGEAQLDQVDSRKVAGRASQN